MSKFTLFDTLPNNLPGKKKKYKSMLTDVVRRPTRVKGMANKPDSVKIEAVKLYLLSGNASAVSAAIGINRRTLHLWMNTNWWAGLVEEIRTEGRVKLNNKLRKIAEKALDVTMDRLENGDFVLSKDGVVRKPVSARDSHRIANDLIIRHKELDEPTKINEQAVEDRLAQLAQAFQAFASKTTRVEIIDAVSEERRDPGLLQGETVGTSSPGEKETASGENGSQESGGEGGESTPRRLPAGGSYPTSESWRIELAGELESGSSEGKSP